jgi:hypothetical protein
MQGNQVRTERVTDRSTTVKVLGMLVLLALMIVLNPEVRVFLLFLDSVTVDLFLLLLALQGRGYLWLLHGAVILPAVRHLADLGPYPLPLPSRWFFTQHPFWAVYATAQLMAVASWIAMQAAIIVVTAATSIVTWPTGKALCATVLAKRQRVGNVLVRRTGAMALGD